MKVTIVVIALATALALQASAQSPKLKVLHNFGSSQDGNHPSGSLFLDGGNLYGTTGGGPGEYSYGIAFELEPQANGDWNETIVHTFASLDGSPWGAFIADSGGNLYGTTVGGPISNSEVYELSPTSGGWDFSALYTNGAGPGLLMDNGGDLYGAIGPGDYFGLGAFGELSPSSSGWIYTQLYSFTCQPSCADGYDPPAPPIWDSKGNLWGTMLYGGIGEPACVNDTDGCGLIYVMTPNGDGTWAYHVVHRFASFPTDGRFPNAGLTLDPAGNFYGETEDGGTYDYGMIFKFSYSSGKLIGNAIYNFSNCSIGCYPEGTLAIDSTGNLYGMAQGGPNGCGLACGVVFRLAPQENGAWKYSVVYNLSEVTGGAPPYYGLILDSKGNLYGITSRGGAYGGGTAFEITP